MIEIERPPQDFIVVQPCDNRDKQKQLATSSSPSDGDEKEEERTNLIQDARQKGRKWRESGYLGAISLSDPYCSSQKTQNHSFSY